MLRLGIWHFYWRRGDSKWVIVTLLGIETDRSRTFDVRMTKLEEVCMLLMGVLNY